MILSGEFGFDIARGNLPIKENKTKEKIERALMIFISLSASERAGGSAAVAASRS